jgi:hypothetical protein
VARAKSVARDAQSDVITWRDAHGRPIRCTPPPDRTSVDLSRDELVEWAALWGVPVDAALRWYDQRDRPPAWLCLHDAATVTEYAPRFLGVV